MPKGKGKFIAAPELKLESYISKRATAIRDELLALLKQGGVGPAMSVSPVETKIEVQRRVSAEGHLLIDLLNSNWVAGKGFENLKNVLVTVRLPEALKGKKLSVRLARPEFADGAFHDAKFKQEGEHEITFAVPELAVYGLVVVSPRDGK